MPKAAFVVLADTESPGDLGRVVNALTASKEFMEAGEDIRMVFDGAGTKWVAELGRPEHLYNELFEEVKDSVDGACATCAKAFGVTSDIERQGIELLNGNEHPSLRELASSGYSVITF